MTDNTSTPTNDARVYLRQFMQDHFEDKTFGDYIWTELADDFARNLCKALHQLVHERTLLATAIAEAAVKAGVARQDAAFDGPMLLMLADDMASVIASAAPPDGPIKRWEQRIDESGRRECEGLAIEMMQAEIADWRAAAAAGLPPGVSAVWIDEAASVVGTGAAQPVAEAAAQADDLPPLTLSVYGTITALELERQRRADIAARAAAPTAQPTPPGAVQQMANAGLDVTYGGLKVAAQPTPPDDELIPCPFCGGECKLTGGWTSDADWPSGHYSQVVCGACKVSQNFHETDAKAIAAWNLRQPGALPDDERARFAKWVKEDRIPPGRRDAHWKTWQRAVYGVEQSPRRTAIDAK